MKSKLLGLILLLALPSLCFAVPPSSFADESHIGWMQTASILVLFMTIPGLAMFYSGLVSSKNALSVIVQCFAIVAIASLLWVLIGYSLCFSDGGAWQPWIGGLSNFFFKGMDARTLPNTTNSVVLAIFQMGFAIITPALITGSVAERIKFSSLIIFIIFWEILVYYPICHWVWGGGWLSKLGMLDFAGGAVVHTNAGIAGLIAALVLGKRRQPLLDKPPHNITLVTIGAGILWIGWFGFNAGSAEEFGLSGMTILVTQVAASVTLLVWMAVEWIKNGKPSASSILFGAIAGLVAITPASGYVGIGGALIIGIVTGLICPWIVTLKFRLAYDDSLDVFGIHGIAGIIGALLTGIFAAPFLGGVGFFAGFTIWKQMGAQLLGVSATILWSGLISLILLWLIKITMGLRVTAEQEMQGLDLEEYGESGYKF